MVLITQNPSLNVSEPFFRWFHWLSSPVEDVLITEITWCTILLKPWTRAVDCWQVGTSAPTKATCSHVHPCISFLFSTSSPIDSSGWWLIRRLHGNEVMQQSLHPLSLWSLWYWQLSQLYAVFGHKTTRCTYAAWFTVRHRTIRCYADEVIN